MPEKVERCVRSLTAKWAKDPKSRPAPRSKDKDGKPQTAESQAWAICTATMKKAGKMEDELTEIMLEGTGMTLMGLAVTNRPHLKGLPPVEIVKKKIGEEEKDFLRIPLLLSGIFSHPQGNLVFNDRIFARIKDNLSGNVVGQDLCVDSRHNPDWGALGWLGPGHPGTGLENEKDILVAYAEPTPIGLEKIQQKAFKYASAELNTNFVNPQIGDKYEAAKLSTDDIKPLCLADMLEQESDIMLQEQTRVVHLLERITNIKLVGNPYRDKAGRFSSKIGGVVGRIGGYVAKTPSRWKRAAGRDVSAARAVGRGIKKTAKWSGGRWKKAAARDVAANRKVSTFAKRVGKAAWKRRKKIAKGAAIVGGVAIGAAVAHSQRKKISAAGKAARSAKVKQLYKSRFGKK